MKILHTADWHLGHSINGFDRYVEQADALRQVVEVVRREQPDAFILAGDIFDTAQPSAAVRRIFSETIVEIRDAAPEMTVVAIAGNHDSGSSHEVFRRPWERLGVHVFGTVNRDDAGSHIIHVGGEDGGIVAALPYTHPRNLPAGFMDELSRMAAKASDGKKPVVLAAHTTIAGCDYSGHSSATEMSAGGIDAVRAEDLGDGYDYIALGHIHRPQTISGTGRRISYSGSLVAVDFSESYRHSVTIAEIGQHGDTPTVRREEIAGIRPLVTLPTRGFATWDHAISLLRQFPDDAAAYIRLNILADSTVPSDASAQAEQACIGKAARFCRLNMKRMEMAGENGNHMSVEELRESDPIEIAMRFAADTGEDLSEESIDMLKATIATVRDELRD